MRERNSWNCCSESVRPSFQSPPTISSTLCFRSILAPRRARAQHSRSRNRGSESTHTLPPCCRCFDTLGTRARVARRRVRVRHVGWFRGLSAKLADVFLRLSAPLLPPRPLPSFLGPLPRSSCPFFHVEAAERARLCADRSRFHVRHEGFSDTKATVEDPRPDPKLIRIRERNREKMIGGRAGRTISGTCGKDRVGIREGGTVWTAVFLRSFGAGERMARRQLASGASRCTAATASVCWNEVQHVVHSTWFGNPQSHASRCRVSWLEEVGEVRTKIPTTSTSHAKLLFLAFLSECQANVPHIRRIAFLVFRMDPCFRNDRVPAIPWRSPPIHHEPKRSGDLIARLVLSGLRLHRHGFFQARFRSLKVGQSFWSENVPETNSAHPSDACHIAVGSYQVHVHPWKAPSHLAGRRIDQLVESTMA